MIRELMRATNTQPVSGENGLTYSGGNVWLVEEEQDGTYTLMNFSMQRLVFGVPASHVEIRPRFVTADGINYTETHYSHTLGPSSKGGDPYLASSVASSTAGEV